MCLKMALDENIWQKVQETAAHVLRNCFVCVQKMALDENIWQKVQETAVHVLKGCFMCC